MTAQGSNSNSMFLYPKTKGEVENFVQDLGFSKLTIYQPGLLLCPREESRPGEFVFQKVNLTIRADWLEFSIFSFFSRKTNNDVFKLLTKTGTFHLQYLSSCGAFDLRHQTPREHAF